MVKLARLTALLLFCFSAFVVQAAEQAGTLPFQQFLQKNGTAAGDLFGYSVAKVGDLNGDGKADFIVGAIFANPGGLVDAGSAFVFSGATGALLYQKNGVDAGDYFGRSVAGVEDVNGDGKPDFIVGAPFASPGGMTAAGSVYIFSGATGALLSVKNGAGSFYQFGTSLANLGDLNGDGRGDYIVGEVGGLGPNPAGSAYLYSGLDGSLLFQKTGAGPGDHFGTSVSGAGDVDGDGKPDFMAAAPNADPGGLTDAGSIYVYSGTAGLLLYQKNGLASGDLLGYSVAGAGDVNGDGRADFIVGAHGADPAGRSNAGSAYLYSGASGALLYQKDGASGGDNFGYSVAGAGDVDGDGNADFAVGAFHADSGKLTSPGSVYLYSGATGELLFLKKGATYADQFAYSVAGVGDADGDGKADFIVGSPFSSPTGLTASGAAYVFSGANGNLLYQKNGTDSLDNFGWTVAGVGDVNLDAKADFIIGAPFANPGGLADAGAAYLYSGATGNLLVQKNGAAAGNNLGYSVGGVADVNGDKRADFIVGAPQASPGGLTAAGSAFVYSGFGASYSLIYQENGAAAGDNFGYSVAGAGDSLKNVNGDRKADFIVGAPFASPGGLAAAGSAYLYSGSDGTLLFQKDGNVAGDHFGHSVGGIGDSMRPDVNGDGRADFIVGAPLASPGGLAAAGSAYLYSGASGALLYQKDGAAAGNNFGSSAAGAGDANSDGKSDFIVGAFRAGPGGLTDAGSAYLYSGATGALLFQKNGAAGGDNLGLSVAGVGDANGDGKAEFIVGVFHADPGGLTNAGSAFLFSGATGAPLYQKDGSASGDFLGFSVAGAGDVNGDGKADLLVAAPKARPNGLANAGSALVFVLVPTDIPKEKGPRPVQFELSQNYPNPFNPTTTISYYLPGRERVVLEIFNLLGQKVKTLVNGEQPAGGHALTWNGTDEKGNVLSSGIYFYRLKTENFSETKKMTFIK